MEPRQTLAQIVETLLDQGYQTEIENLTQLLPLSGKILAAKDFSIDALYIVEDGDGDGRDFLVAAISSKKLKTKLLLVNAFSVYTSYSYTETFEKMKKLINRIFPFFGH